jgi:hypothetical protein
MRRDLPPEAAGARPLTGRRRSPLPRFGWVFSRVGMRCLAPDSASPTALGFPIPAPGVTEGHAIGITRIIGILPRIRPTRITHPTTPIDPPVTTHRSLPNRHNQYSHTDYYNQTYMLQPVQSARPGRPRSTRTSGAPDSGGYRVARLYRVALSYRLPLLVRVIGTLTSIATAPGRAGCTRCVDSEAHAGPKACARPCR